MTIANKRILKVLAAVPLATCSVLAPFPLPLRLVAFAVPALFLLATALAGGRETRA
jgi:hypothetical protein